MAANHMNVRIDERKLIHIDVTYDGVTHDLCVGGAREACVTPSSATASGWGTPICVSPTPGRRTATRSSTRSRLRKTIPPYDEQQEGK